MTGDGSGAGAGDDSGDVTTDDWEAITGDEAVDGHGADGGDAAAEDSEDFAVETVRERVLAEHGDVVATVLDCADAVVAESPDALGDGRRLATRLESELADAGVLARLPAVLATAVDALGESLPADPVAAPPYVVVTGRGPMCRATLERGRLVLLVRAFALADGRTTSRIERDYRRVNRSLADALVVALR